MVADLQGGGLAQRTGRGSGNGVPFKIQGTTSDPKFVPDVAGLAGSAAAGAVQKAVSGKTGATGGLLKKKRP